jgi:SAM-dependent methyltransferase
MTLYAYDRTFFEYQQTGSLASARAIVPLLLHHLKPRSVLDVGCGAGAWVRAYLEAGAVDVMGVDGPYLQAHQLLFTPSKFRTADVARPFTLGRSFDMAQCLEVAEHLDSSAAETLVDNLTAHAEIIVFSAAPPGQGGEHHVNERPYDYWRGLFENRGYAFHDFVRPAILVRGDIEPWYRYNTMLFVSREAAPTLEPAVAATRWPVDRPVRDLAPLSWRLRRALLSRLPVAAVSSMAAVKHHLHLLARSSSPVSR